MRIPIRSIKKIKHSYLHHWTSTIHKQNMAATSSLVMIAHPPAEERTLESIPPAAIERALEDDVLRVTAELRQPGEGGESPMLEVQIMAITGDVFPVQVSRDDTVRNRCRQQQDMNCSCVDQGVALEQQAKIAMQANGRVELFFEGNPVSPGE